MRGKAGKDGLASGRFGRFPMRVLLLCAIFAIATAAVSSIGITELIFGQKHEKLIEEAGLAAGELERSAELFAETEQIARDAGVQISGLPAVKKAYRSGKREKSSGILGKIFSLFLLGLPGTAPIP